MSLLDELLDELGPKPRRVPVRTSALPRQTVTVRVDRPVKAGELVVLRPLAEVLAPRPLAPAAPGRVWKSSCKERCGDTGHACAIPAPHPGVPHGDARGPFRRLAVPGQTHFRRDELLETAAHERLDDGSRDGAFAKERRGRAPINTNQETNDGDVRDVREGSALGGREAPGGEVLQVPEGGGRVDGDGEEAVEGLDAGPASVAGAAGDAGGDGDELHAGAAPVEVPQGE